MILQIVYALADKEKKDVANINDELTNMAMNVSTLDALTNKAILDASTALSAINVADVSIDRLIAAQAVLSQNLNSLYEISIQMASVIGGLNNSLNITNSSANAAYDSIGLDASLKPDWEGMFEDGTTIVSAIKQGGGGQHIGHVINFKDIEGNLITSSEPITQNGFVKDLVFPKLEKQGIRTAWPLVKIEDLINITEDIDIQQQDFSDMSKHVIRMDDETTYATDEEFALLRRTDIQQFASSDTLEEVPSMAFFKCQQLEDVELSETVVHIGMKAFYYCCAIGQFTVPSQVQTIGKEAFMLCTDLEDLYITGPIEIIPEGMCYSCSALKNIELPNTITEIHEAAFAACDHLRTFTIPETVTLMESQIFSSCETLNTLVINASVNEIPYQMCYGCKSLHYVTLPNLVEIIGGSAFSGCEYLEDIIIPASVKKIDECAFAGTGLKHIEIKPTITYGKDCFADIKGIIDVTIDPMIERMGQIFTGSDLSEVELPAGIKELNYTFKDCYNLTEITLPEGLEDFTGAFSGTGLEDIHFPAVTYSSVRGFDGYPLPDGKYMITKADGNSGSALSFESKEKARAQNPSSPETIYAYTLYVGDFIIIENNKFQAHTYHYNGSDAIINPYNGGDDLQDLCVSKYDNYNPTIYLGDIPVTWNWDNRKNHTVGNIVIGTPPALTKISPYAFAQCSELTTLELPNYITKIEDHAFEHTALEEVHLPSGITELGNDVFAYCQKLGTLDLGQTMITELNAKYSYAVGKLVEDAEVELICPPTMHHWAQDFAYSGLTKITFLGALTSFEYMQYSSIYTEKSMAYLPRLKYLDVSHGISTFEWSLFLSPYTSSPYTVYTNIEYVEFPDNWEASTYLS